MQVALAGIVGQRGGGRLVEDADDFQPGQFAGLAGGLALGVVEVGGHGDDGLADIGTQLGRGAVAELAQDHGRDFLRPKFLLAELDLDVLAHLALDRLDGALRGQHPLVAGRLADQQAAVLGQSDERGQDRIAVLVVRTCGWPSRTMATSLLVVPRSMPMIGSMLIARRLRRFRKLT